MLLIPLPALALGGVAGAFAGPLVLSYVLAVAVSMVVALVVTPALSMVLMGGASLQRRTGPRRRRPGAWVRPVGPRLHPAALGVRRACRAGPRDDSRWSHSWPSNEPMLPALQDRDLLIHWAGGTGDVAAGDDADHRLRQPRSCAGSPGSSEVGSHLGRALMADQSGNVNSGEMWVSARPIPPTTRRR